MQRQQQVFTNSTRSLAVSLRLTGTYILHHRGGDQTTVHLDIDGHCRTSHGGVLWGDVWCIVEGVIWRRGQNGSICRWKHCGHVCAWPGCYGSRGGVIVDWHGSGRWVLGRGFKQCLFLISTLLILVHHAQQSLSLFYQCESANTQYRV